MPTPIPQSIRELLLAEIQAQQPNSQIAAPLTQTSVLTAVSKKVGYGVDQQAILTQWSELFRTGLLAWGLNLSNPNPPFFHLTERGRQALSNATRDPSNPAGYMRHLASVATLDAVSMSYLAEALECYVAGLFKAAAVMVGGAAESVILTLRDLIVQNLTAQSRSIPKGMEDWRIKTVSDALHKFLDSHSLPRDLRDPFDAYWSAFALQIRTVRNDAGHPTSVDPVTSDTVHASLLIFPELAKLANNLSQWVHANI